MLKPEYHVTDRVRVRGYDDPPLYGRVVSISAYGGDIRAEVETEPSEYFTYLGKPAPFTLTSSFWQFELVECE